MISKRGKTTNVQFASFKKNFNSRKVEDFYATNPSELTYIKKPLKKPRKSSSFLATGRDAKTMTIKGNIGGSNPEGVEVGRYTPRYQKRKIPSYTFSKKPRDTKLFLFADYTWIRDVNKRYVSLKTHSFK